jgi:DnaK suppressor protein
VQKTRLERYRRRLEQEYQDAQALLSRTAEAIRKDQGASPEDAAEQAVNSYAKELFSHQSDAERLHLQFVREALERIPSKDFGLCQSCGEAIDRKRLDAVPWARYCRRCQEAEEQNEFSHDEEPEQGERG